MGVRRTKHAVYDLKYHLVWIPKYRKEVLDKEISDYLKTEISFASVPNVVEKGIGISYPIEKPNKNKGGHADGERIPQEAGIDHVRAGIIAGRACRPAAGAVCQGGSKAAVNGRPRGRGDRRSHATAL
jgi:hypothetical protein